MKKITINVIGDTEELATLHQALLTLHLIALSSRKSRDSISAVFRCFQMIELLALGIAALITKPLLEPKEKVVVKTVTKDRIVINLDC